MGEVWKTLSVAIAFQVFSTIQGKTVAENFVILAPRLYNSYNHAHVPGPPIWPSRRGNRTRAEGIELEPPDSLRLTLTTKP